MTTGWFLGYLHEKLVGTTLFDGKGSEPSILWGFRSGFWWFLAPEKNLLHFTTLFTTCLFGWLAQHGAVRYVHRTARTSLEVHHGMSQLPTCPICSLSHPEAGARNWSRQNHREVPKRRDSVVENICSTSDLPIFSVIFSHLPWPIGKTRPKSVVPNMGQFPIKAMGFVWRVFHEKLARQKRGIGLVPAISGAMFPKWSFSAQEGWFIGKNQCSYEAPFPKTSAWLATPPKRSKKTYIYIIYIYIYIIYIIYNIYIYNKYIIYIYNIYNILYNSDLCIYLTKNSGSILTPFWSEEQI